MLSLINFVKENGLPYLFLASWAQRYVGKQYPPIPGDLSRAAAHMPMFGNIQSLKLAWSLLLLTRMSKRVQKGVCFAQHSV